MHIRLKSFGPLRRLMSGGETTLELPDISTVHTVIEEIVRKWGSEAENLIMENSQISGNLIIMLNMKDISTLDGLNTTIEPNDEIIILPHVQGG
ncbi:MAG: MoaD/ThiS family protein [Candidatus Thorarchaeota archaeon]